MQRLPRLILIRGGRRLGGDRESAEKPVRDKLIEAKESGEVYRADYTHLWRLPAPLPPRRFPYVRVITVGLVMMIALGLAAGW